MVGAVVALALVTTLIFVGAVLMPMVGFVVADAGVAPLGFELGAAPEETLGCALATVATALSSVAPRVAIGAPVVASASEVVVA